MNELQPRPDLIPIGECAPDFSAMTDRGETIRLSELQGKKRVVLVFYPGDNTPLCTAQLCALRDDWTQFEAEDTVVYGINAGSRERHRKFAEKNGFPFPLLVDEGGKIAAAFGCRGLFGMLRRTVYALDKQGRVVFAQRGNPAPPVILETLRDTARS